MKKLLIISTLVTLGLGACVPGMGDEIQSLNPANEPESAFTESAPIKIEETEITEQISQPETGTIKGALQIEVDDIGLVGCLICDFDYSLYAGPLTEVEVQGLLLVLNDEYHAWAVYDQVLTDFGSETRPFVNIRDSEAQHFYRLINLFETYNLPVPENAWIGNAPSFDSVANACAAGVDAELVNVALYERAFESTDRADIITVYEALQRASNEKHLPAFERCGGNR